MEEPLPPDGLPICIIHKRFAEAFLDDKYWCDICMDEIINPDGWYLHRSPDGDYWLTGHIVDEWQLLGSFVTFREARNEQLRWQYSGG